VDKDGFSVGIYAKPGVTVEFRYTAMTILTSAKESTDGPAKPATTNPRTKI
jgi:hypothetical protein